MTVDELLKEADELFSKKDFRRLKWVCIDILKEDPDNEAALTYQAYVYWARDEDIRALRIVDRIFEINLDNFHAYNLKAMDYLVDHHFEKALDCCDRGLEISDYYWLRINRIEALICLDRIDEALEYYNASKIPNYRFEYGLINCAKLLELSQYGDFSKDELMDYLFEKTEYIWNRRDVKEFFESELENDGNDEIALTFRAYYIDGYDELFETAGKIHEMYPDNCHSYNVEALEYLKIGKFADALECCDEGLKIRDYEGLKISRIEALICLGRTDEAFEFYRASQTPDYSFTKALVHCEKYSEIPDYDEGISKENLVECLLNKCRYLNLGPCPDHFYAKNRKIIEACGEIFKRDKDNEVALGYKAYSLNHLRKYGEALRCCDYAIGLYPDNFRFYYVKAEILFNELNDLDGAIENYGKMVELDVNEDIGPFDLIYALRKKISELLAQGNYSDAIDCCERIMCYPEYNESRLKALFTIESIVENHGIEYEPSDNYLETLEENRLVHDCMNADFDGYDSDYIEGCRQFKDYESFVDYLRDFMICLIELSPDDEKSIRERMKFELGDIKLGFDLEKPAYCEALEYVENRNKWRWEYRRRSLW